MATKGANFEKLADKTFIISPVSARRWFCTQ
jgi:hypothetical protein